MVLSSEFVLFGRLLFELDDRAFGYLILPTGLERFKLSALNPVMDRPEVYAVPLRHILHAENSFQCHPSFQKFLAIRVALCYIMFNTYAVALLFGVRVFLCVLTGMDTL
jgi:hypothetical protein